ncbi:MAG: DUF421 domain-containing protein [Rhodothalassiaceae bacterium]
MPPFVFDGFSILLKTLINAPLLYVAVIVFVRVSGKRTTSQLNNFDWILMVAMGSLVAAAMVQSVTLVESLFAILMLVLLQHGVTWISFRSERMEGMVKTEPRLLLADGHLLRGAMRRERVTEAELMSALRSNGLARFDQAQWVIFESDATFSVFPKQERTQPPTALKNVDGLAPLPKP